MKITIEIPDEQADLLKRSAEHEGDASAEAYLARVAGIELDHKAAFFKGQDAGNVVDIKDALANAAPEKLDQIREILSLEKPADESSQSTE